MPSNPEDATGKAEDAMAQIARLRAQVETLMRERVAPAVADATEYIESAARDATGAVRVGADELAGTVRQHPLTAVLVAAGIGFLLGRVSR